MRKSDFPIFQKHKKLVYLDTAATAQKPEVVIDAVEDFLEDENAPVHRSLYPLGEQATEKFEAVRGKVAKFIHAPDPREIIFTRNATESLNIIAQAFGRACVRKGDTIVVSRMEHHANFVPWLVLAKEKKAELRIVELTPDGHIDLEDLRKKLNRRTKIVSIAHVSNVLGTINPLEKIRKAIRRYGGKAARPVFVVDAAQSAPHVPLSVQKFGCDFLVFSGHKLYGPGVGVLWGRREILENMPPFLTGGQMIREVRDDDAVWNEVPYKFEAGTPDTADIIGLGAAVDYVSRIGWARIIRHERALMAVALRRFAALERRGIAVVYGPKNARERCGVLSFTIQNVHPHDVGSLLAEEGIAVRASHHCAMSLHRSLGVNATVRISFGLYNERRDVDRFFDALETRVLPFART